MLVIVSWIGVILIIAGVGYSALQVLGADPSAGVGARRRKRSSRRAGRRDRSASPGNGRASP